MAIGSSSSSSMLHRSEEDQENEEQDIHPKKRRNLRIPYPDAEIIALSPTTLMAKNRFICEICLKGFPREQNLQLHKRGHNLPWKLKQSTPKDEVKKKAYICPEPSCIHHNRSHSLGDLTGIKKHYSRKHGEKKYKCRKCAKMYAVQSDLKAHTKTCGKKEYRCHCGTFFSRHDSFISHRAFCEALVGVTFTGVGSSSISTQMSLGLPDFGTCVPSIQNLIHTSPSITVTKRDVSHLGHTSENNNITGFNYYRPTPPFSVLSVDQQNLYSYHGNVDTRAFTNLTTTMGTQRNFGTAAMMPQISATTLLQKASLLGSTWSNNSAQAYATCFSSNIPNYFCSNDHANAGPSLLNLNAGATYEQQYQPLISNNVGLQQSSGATMFTRDFLGVGGEINVSSDDPESTVVGRSFL